MPDPNETTYKAYPSTGRGTINTGTTLNVDFGTLRMGTSMVVTNFDSSNVFELQLNSSANDSITIPASQSMVFNAEKIRSAFLTNASGSAILYQVVILGG